MNPVVVTKLLCQVVDPNTPVDMNRETEMKRTIMNTNTRTLHVAAVAMIIGLAGGLSNASVNTQDSPTTPVALSSAQIQSIRSAYNWLDRDAGILTGTITPRTIFVESPGLKERSDYLNVQVKARSQMITQVTRDAALTKAAVPFTASQTRGAAIIDSAAIEFEAMIAAADDRIVQARARLAPSLREAFADVDMHSVKIPAGVSAEVAAEALMQTGDYEFVSIDWICYPVETTPNDPLFGTQWHHQASRLDTGRAWDFTQGSSDTIIGVCDSGVDLDHPDLMAALVPGYNAEDNIAQVDGGNVNDDLVGHGTLVAGAAAAIGNNSTGVSGVGWNFGIMPIKVTNNASGTANLSDILEGARWASDNGAYTSNCSFGGAEDSATLSTGGHIRLEGHLLVFAAGNDGLANQVNDWEKVTIVGASGQSDTWLSWSHTGIGIDCIAPGVNIRSTNRTGGYTFTTGTSFSAPITAGAMMLVHDANPALTADEVEFILLNACDDKQAPGQDNQTGWGRINIGRAVEDAIFGPSTINFPFEDFFPDNTLSSLWRNPVGDVGVDLGALNLNDTESIETVTIRAGFLGGDTAKIEFHTRHLGVEAGETLDVEYFSILNQWTNLLTLTSDGIDQAQLTEHQIVFPGLGMHDAFKLRFVANGSDATDNWYIDNVSVAEFSNNTLPWSDSFESGITLVFDWDASTASASADASNEPDGTMSALLNDQDTMTSVEVDSSQALEVVYYRFFVQHNGVESGETLDIEYKNMLGSWNTLTTLVSDGIDQADFELIQLPFPFDAYGGMTAIRFTANGDEADDQWFVDSVAITTEFIVIDPSCPADLNDDGLYNFFDISTFLSLFSALDLAADFNDDGLFNFFDVSAFLGAFAAGCP